MKTKHVYLVLGLPGVVLPCSQFLPWIAEHALDLPLLIEQIVTSRIAAFDWLDAIGPAVALFVLVLIEGRGRKVSGLWLSIVGTLWGYRWICPRTCIFLKRPGKVEWTDRCPPKPVVTSQSHAGRLLPAASESDNASDLPFH